MSLARLLADIQPFSRNDVLLMLLFSQTRHSLSGLTTATMKHCSSRFAIEHVASKRGDVAIQGMYGLWTGAMEYFREKSPKGSCFHARDGGDGVPLYVNWLSLIEEEHARTLVVWASSSLERHIGWRLSSPRESQCRFSRSQYWRPSRRC